MTVQTKNIIPRKQAEAGTTTQYTSENAKTLIDKFTATNTTGSTETITVYLVASGGAASAGNMVVQAQAVLPGETYDFLTLVGQGMESGGFIATATSTGSALTISAQGRLIT